MWFRDTVKKSLLFSCFNNNTVAALLERGTPSFVHKDPADSPFKLQQQHKRNYFRIKNIRQPNI